MTTEQKYNRETAVELISKLPTNFNNIDNWEKTSGYDGICARFANGATVQIDHPSIRVYDRKGNKLIDYAPASIDGDLARTLAELSNLCTRYVDKLEKDLIKGIFSEIEQKP